MKNIVAIAILACLPVIVVGQNPAICGQLTCPGFTVIENSTEYEVRRYEPSAWVVTNVSDSSNTSAAFIRLYLYLDGHNDRNEKINMSVPVLRATRSDNTSTIMFYLNTHDPPTPSNPRVELFQSPEKSFYVRVFTRDHLPTPDEYQRELEALETALGTQSEYNTSVTYFAGYHPPYFQGLRHHEVWLEKL